MIILNNNKIPGFLLGLSSVFYSDIGTIIFEYRCQYGDDLYSSTNDAGTYIEFKPASSNGSPPIIHTLFDSSVIVDNTFAQ